MAKHTTVCQKSCFLSWKGWGPACVTSWIRQQSWVVVQILLRAASMRDSFILKGNQVTTRQKDKEEKEEQEDEKDFPSASEWAAATSPGTFHKSSLTPGVTPGQSTRLDLAHPAPSVRLCGLQPGHTKSDEGCACCSLWRRVRTHPVWISPPGLELLICSMSVIS